MLRGEATHNDDDEDKGSSGANKAAPARFACGIFSGTARRGADGRSRAGRRECTLCAVVLGHVEIKETMRSDAGASRKKRVNIDFPVRIFEPMFGPWEGFPKSAASAAMPLQYEMHMYPPMFNYRFQVITNHACTFARRGRKICTHDVAS